MNMEDNTLITLKFVIDMIKYNDSGDHKEPRYTDYFRTQELIDYLDKVNFIEAMSEELIVEGLEKLVADGYLKKGSVTETPKMQSWDILKEFE